MFTDNKNVYKTEKVKSPTALQSMSFNSVMPKFYLELFTKKSPNTQQLP